MATTAIRTTLTPLPSQSTRIRTTTNVASVYTTTTAINRTTIISISVIALRTPKEPITIPSPYSKTKTKNIARKTTNQVAITTSSGTNGTHTTNSNPIINGVNITAIVKTSTGSISSSVINKPKSLWHLQLDQNIDLNLSV